MMGSTPAPAVRLRERDRDLSAAGDHWWRPAAAADHHLLSRAVGPVLDVGCGPGRHVVALAERGVPVLGIDVAAVALTAARERGVLVLERSVFGRVPGAGRWATALLLDGNVGIGGRPVSLLQRVEALLRPGGRVIVEVGGPGTSAPVRTVRLEIGTVCGPWFRWAHVAIDELPLLAARAAMTVQERWSAGARWFAVLAARVGMGR
jgi:SAM-dependent methyltransferase